MLTADDGDDDDNYGDDVHDDEYYNDVTTTMVLTLTWYRLSVIVPQLHSCDRSR